MFKGANILVTGSEGMIGKELVKLLVSRGAKIKCADLKNGYDLTSKETCDNLTKNVDFVFHLAGIKGNPKMTSESPVDFMGPMLQFDTNMIICAQKNGVKRFLYTSSIAVENPESDKYPAWAKQTAETLIEAHKVQYPNGTKFCIVRPANVYGKYDNYKAENPMVITSLVLKSISDNSFFHVWGDGTQIRDFIHAKDVALGMIDTIEHMPLEPINLCSGEEVTIDQVAGELANLSNKSFKYDKSKPTGPNKKVMIPNSKTWSPTIKLRDGLKEVYEHARDNWDTSTQ